MKKEKDTELDDLFKKELEHPVYHTGYREDDWDALEDMLDGDKKRPGLIFWLPVLSTAAALLIFFGWWLFRPQGADNHGQKPSLAIVKHTQQSSISTRDSNSATKTTIGATSPKKTLSATKINNIALAPPRVQKKRHDLPGSLDSRDANKKNNGTVGVQINTGNHANLIAGNTVINKSAAAGAKTSDAVVQTADATPVADRPKQEMIAALSARLDDDIVVNRQPVAMADISSTHFKMPVYKEDKDDKSSNRIGFLKHPQFALTVLGAPEINSVSSVSENKTGSNFGLLFSAGVSSRFTISTGANYTAKPYYTDIANYHTPYPFKTDPTSIEADCRMLDIPLNVDYAFYNKHNNKFTVGTGISSYLMLHESYDFNYADPTAKGPATYTVSHPDQYFFGILNLQATYQRQFSSKFGLSVTPYIKIPMSNIGYSQVKLQTTGIALGVSWNLNSLTKP